MAGKTLDEACMAQRNARRAGCNGTSNSQQTATAGNNGQQTPTATANVATSARAPGDSTVTINSQTFILTPAASVPASVNTAVTMSNSVFSGNLSDYDTNSSTFAPSVNIALAPDLATPGNGTFSNTDSETDTMSLHDQTEYKAYVALTGPSHTSVDWRTNSTNVDPLVTAISPIAFMANHPPISRMGSIPFILDSGANCHISPKCGDFKSLNTIPPLTVKGFSGSSVQAVGMGTIEVCMASGLRLSLTNILFVPNSKIRLLSVSSLNRSGNYVTHLDSMSCWVTNRSGAMKMYRISSIIFHNFYYPSADLLHDIVTSHIRSSVLFATWIHDMVDLNLMAQF
jgi:hypothetical protein